MAGKFMRIKKFTIYTMTAIILASQLAGCAIMSQDEMVEMIEAGEILEIEISVPEEQCLIAKKDQTWVQLDKLKTYNNGFRPNFDTLLNVNTFKTAEGSSKQGSMFTVNYNDSDVQYGNSTLRDSFRNEVFVKKYWGDTKIQSKMASLASETYVDVDGTGTTSAIAALNAYFNLMSEDGDDDGTFEGSKVLSREQFATLMYRAGNGVTDLGYIPDGDEFTSAVGGDTQYTMYAKQLADKMWLDYKNGSLNSTNIGTPITKLEVAYMLVNTYFSNKYESADTSGTALGVKNAGNLALEIGAQSQNKETGETTYGDAWQNNVLAYMLTHQDKGVQEEVFKAIKVAEQLGLFSGIGTDIFDPITKAEAIMMLVNTYKAENSVYGYSTTSEYPSAYLPADNVGADYDWGTGEPETIGGNTDDKTKEPVTISAELNALFEQVWTNGQSARDKMGYENALTEELLIVNNMISSGQVPSNGFELYKLWRNAVHPESSLDDSESTGELNEEDTETESTNPGLTIGADGSLTQSSELNEDKAQ